MKSHLELDLAASHRCEGAERATMPVDVEKMSRYRTSPAFVHWIWSFPKKEFHQQTWSRQSSIVLCIFVFFYVFLENVTQNGSLSFLIAVHKHDLY